jgi:hypothetical protein
MNSTETKRMKTNRVRTQATRAAKPSQARKTTGVTVPTDAEFRRLGRIVVGLAHRLGLSTAEVIQRAQGGALLMAMDITGRKLRALRQRLLDAGMSQDAVDELTSALMNGGGH